MLRRYWLTNDLTIKKPRHDRADGAAGVKGTLDTGLCPWTVWEDARVPNCQPRGCVQTCVGVSGSEGARLPKGDVTNNGEGKRRVRF
jgi:hypothetical protein